MVAFFCPPPFMGTSSKASAAYVDTQSNSTGATTYNFTANLGSGPYCVLIISARATANLTVASVTVDGQAATQAVYGVYNGGSAFSLCGIFIVPASGSGKTVSVQWSMAAARCSIDVFDITGLQSATPTATATDSASPFTQAINCNAGGFIIGGAMTNAGATWTWTNLTERADYIVGGSTGFSSACDNFNTAQVGRSITAAPTSGAQTVMALASFR